MLRLLRLAVVAAGVSAAVRSSMMHPWPLLHRRLQESSGLIGNACRDTTDCPGGSVCIAGSATTSIQSCVQTPGCGGNVAGNCPGLLSTGQLVCAWSPVNASQCSDFQNSCAAFNGQSGIYMCMSLDRCDAINGNKGVCSSGCKSSNGLICNGRGGCQTKNGASYMCECNDGWDGPACEKVVNSSCQAGVGSCGQFGQCIDGACTCIKGYSGQQCELSPNATTSPSVVTLPTPTSDSASSSSKATAGGSSSPANTSWWWILLVVVVALAFVLIVAFFVRKKMQQREADRARTEVGELMEGDLDDGVQTPKGMIQTL
ncbi:hypothetical protein SPRG_06892 [Saprolegnia parasitica CBS 223.65]|uniref:EGF-like domain-containing protein n=1 Tax=Saprolegnia parasitica (strain CBS 223.65) TaxID=695850 RepID=A0A067CLE4_SAPPC|nr:hypothetical protein SPRG_06892 [Saprolegnia parasitica CBS 223.65]KDO27622.1 hypothetical protein SPRG_06892 [Saprolegnia parasitica CBS 223.65]|eukprot:XP_012201744.1 hypothetical protein SPRG_06892 [Saprolegnia parasitica CBS 223.65]